MIGRVRGGMFIKHTHTCIGVRALKEDCKGLHDQPCQLFLFLCHIVLGIT